MLDIGTNHHLIPNSSRVPHASSYTRSGSVLVSDGNNLEITSVISGTLVAPDHCMSYVHNVIHTPQALINMLSIQKLCEDNKLFIEFYSDWFSIKGLHTMDVVLQGKSENGLCKVSSTMNSFPAIKGTSLVVYNIASLDVPDVAKVYMKWHCKLGHSSYDITITILCE